MSNKKEQQEEVVEAIEKVEETTEQPKEEVKAEEKVEEKKEEPKKPAAEVADDGTIKIDLRNFKKEEDATGKQSTDEVPVRNESETSGEVREENKQTEDEKPSGESTGETKQEKEKVNEEEPVLELVNEEEEKSLQEKIKDIPNKLKEEPKNVNNKEETQELPENINKLVEFMNETGGSLEDYVKLNKDYSKMEDMDVLREYYRQSKPHLSEEEISFLMEDTFSYDEEEDEERDIKRKKLRLKESIAEAKSNLTGLKQKYYDDLKLSSKLTPEQREAVKLYDDYKQEQQLSTETAQRHRSIFEQKTNEVFSQNFKGFEYKVGENRYRFKVKDVDKVKDTQSDINSLVSRYVNKENEMNDAAGYHKALFTAMNADSIANHFYEQGRADAIKESMAKSKNIDMDPRATHQEVTTNTGFKVRAVSGDDADRLRVRFKQ